MLSSVKIIYFKLLLGILQIPTDPYCRNDYVFAIRRFLIFGCVYTLLIYILP